jgi:hypothetical protein
VAKKQAARKMRQLRCHYENFFNYANRYVPDIHITSNISAERPDSDFKDLVLTHAHTAH